MPEVPPDAPVVRLRLELEQARLRGEMIGAPGVGLGVTVWRRPRPHRAILLAEGESDALAACSAVDGLAVASIPGVGFPVERLVGLLYELGVAGVVLAMDGDRPGDAFAARAAPRLEQAGDRCPAAGVVLLAGKPKPGKSTLACAVLEALGLGAKTFLGRPITATGAVFVTEEGDGTLVEKLPKASNVRVLTRDAAGPRPSWGRS